MTRRASLRWRLVAWVVAVMLVGFAIVFVVVYEQTEASCVRVSKTTRVPTSPSSARRCGRSGLAPRASC